MPDYHTIRQLGAGQFGEVWLVEDKAFGEVRAVKFVPPSKISNPTNFYHEPQALKALQHENVVLVSDAGTMDDGRLYVAMEYVQKGSIEDVFGGRVVPLRIAVRLLIDICKGLAYTHDRGFVHRDIKPANILVTDNGRAKISDFGLCTNRLSAGAASAQGYVTHIAPEVLLNNASTASSDLYAVGVTAYRIINGDALLPAVSSQSDLFDRIIAGTYPDREIFKPFVPKRLRKIIRKTLSKDPSNRYESPRKLRHALESLHLSLDWEEESSGSSLNWIGTSDRPRWKVVLEESKTGHYVTVCRLDPSGRTQTVKKSSGFFPKKKDAMKHIVSVFEALNTGNSLNSI